VSHDFCGTIHAMKPLSRHKRYTYLFICYVLFFALIPVVAFYASGYRIGEDWTVTQTGGFFVHTSENGVLLTVDNEPSKVLGIFGSGFFVQNLKPGIYDIAVTKTGFVPWYKKVAVFEGVVEETSSLLIPERIIFQELKADEDSTLLESGLATTTDKDSRTISSGKSIFEIVSKSFEENVPVKEEEIDRDELLELFPENAIIKDEVVIYESNNSIETVWLGKQESIPYFFCIFGDCEAEIIAYVSPEDIVHFDFYPNRTDTIIISTEKGIYAVSLDKTPPQFFHPIYKSSGSDFRVVEGNLYIKDGQNFYRVLL